MTADHDNKKMEESNYATLKYVYIAAICPSRNSVQSQ